MVQNMVKLWSKYGQKHGRNIFKICPKYGQYDPKYGKNMVQNIVQILVKCDPKYVQNMIQNMVKIWSKIWLNGGGCVSLYSE